MNGTKCFWVCATVLLSIDDNLCSLSSLAHWKMARNHMKTNGHITPHWRYQLNNRVSDSFIKCKCDVVRMVGVLSVLLLALLPFFLQIMLKGMEKMHTCCTMRTVQTPSFVSMNYINPHKLHYVRILTYKYTKLWNNNLILYSKYERFALLRLCWAHIILFGREIPL